MAAEMEFFIFLLQQYAAEKKQNADVILNQWDALGITSTIYDMYEMYHCEALENAFQDIDNMISEKTKM